MQKKSDSEAPNQCRLKPVFSQGKNQESKKATKVSCRKKGGKVGGPECSFRGNIPKDSGKISRLEIIYTWRKEEE